jgi:hypothetical protein
MNTIETHLKTLNHNQLRLLLRELYEIMYVATEMSQAQLIADATPLFCQSWQYSKDYDELELAIRNEIVNRFITNIFADEMPTGEVPGKLVSNTEQPLC